METFVAAISTFALACLVLQYSVKGESFVLAYPGRVYNHPNPTVHAISCGQGGTMDIFVADDDSVISVNVSNAYTHYFPDDIVTTSGTENKTVIISSLDDIHVYGIAAWSMFTPISVMSLGIRYMLSFCTSISNGTDTHSYILIIASHKDHANIEIEWRAAGTIMYDGATYVSGDVLRVTLAPYQTFTLRNDADMTGTTITSLTGTIAVFNGGESFTRHSKLPYLTSYDQLPPLDWDGTEFVFLSMHYHQNEVTTLTVTANEDTSISFNNGSTVVIDDKQFYREDIFTQRMFELKTNSPAMVTLCYHEDFTLQYAYESLFVVPPVNAYIQHTAIIHDHVNVIAEKADVHRVAVHDANHNNLNVSWRDVAYTNYVFGAVEKGPSQVFITSDRTFTAFAVGPDFGRNGGYNFTYTNATGKSNVYYHAIHEYRYMFISHRLSQVLQFMF
ncbi:IgGFc-binding protein-like [Haliotis rufescens]|uniref:IgGFc-binding protein-like n=1 Tax=Haliotis rufescens TaxID=6454 RepID=UPI00201EBEB5|nr:IgGFc-binding protein-like [Haliotis rufescens]